MTKVFSQLIFDLQLLVPHITFNFRQDKIYLILSFYSTIILVIQYNRY